MLDPIKNDRSGGHRRQTEIGQISKWDSATSGAIARGVLMRLQPNRINYFEK